ncbi:hypothetical protein CAPI_02085 [Corynebacterium capitovis DSM 44611]|uniref:acyl-CoA carboxylase subunit epsilon n=1 Tax=Corynebacterium capitovis TaxID=131081 RepID=UPI00037DAF28|nr:acyl-CoA carboxylase subunit epsilon [Corynebacterium capitovis]WKD56991.1 hypothetical protein CAPI_02085 [Corynebacterium capitovis DSM 44611]
MTTPTFTVVKGHPTDDELAALTAVLADLQSSAAASAGPQSGADRNLWGSDLPGHPHVFNPGAFANITYF